MGQLLRRYVQMLLRGMNAADRTGAALLCKRDMLCCLVSGIVAHCYFVLQYLDSLCFTSASWAEGVAAPEGEHGSPQCHVAPVCQRGDHQAPVVALVLIAVGEDRQHL